MTTWGLLTQTYKIKKRNIQWLLTLINKIDLRKQFKPVKGTKPYDYLQDDAENFELKMANIFIGLCSIIKVYMDFNNYGSKFGGNVLIEPCMYLSYTFGCKKTTNTKNKKTQKHIVIIYNVQIVEQMATNGKQLIEKYYKCKEGFVKKMSIINEFNVWETILKDFKFKEEANNEKNGEEQEVSNENHGNGNANDESNENNQANVNVQK